MSGYCMYSRYPEWESRLWITLNAALMRSAWAASLCWLTVACVNGYSGPINWFLSLKLWKFIARISYAMYLFHYPLQFIARGADSTPIYFSMENGFMYFGSDLVYTVAVSVAACVLIDAPCSTLIRRLMTAIAPKRAAPAAAKQTVQDVSNVETNGTETSEEKIRTE